MFDLGAIELGVTAKNRTNRIKYNVRFGERITDLLSVWLYFIIDEFFIMTDRNSMNECFRPREAAPSKPTYFIVYYKFRQDQSSIDVCRTLLCCMPQKKTVHKNNKTTIFDIFIRFLPRSQVYSLHHSHPLTQTLLYYIFV